MTTMTTTKTMTTQKTIQIVPYNRLRNPFNGRLSAGFRFRFKVRAISHSPIYLPIEMKELPQVKLLLQGVSPLKVFNRQSIFSARQAFNELRKQFDFPFWAASDYLVKDIDDPDTIVPLRLNYFQHYIIDIFLKRYHKRQNGHYIITKSFGKCGLTTCVQAYILWQQSFVWAKHSNTCSASEILINPLKTNLCRFLKRDLIPPDKGIFLPKADGRHAFFNTFHSPDALRGIDFGFVHFADMSRWYDPEANLTERAFIAAYGGIIPSHKPLFVLEGNVPKPHVIDNLLSSCKNSPSDVPATHQLANICRNPYFLHEVLYSMASGPSSHFHLISL